MRFDTLPLINFQPVDCTKPIVDLGKLRKYQTYCLDICLSNKTENSPNELSHRNRGPISYFRCLTNTNILFRFYLNTASPSQKLIVIVTIVQCLIVGVL